MTEFIFPKILNHSLIINDKYKKYTNLNKNQIFFKCIKCDECFRLMWTNTTCYLDYQIVYPYEYGYECRSILGNIITCEEIMVQKMLK